MPVPRPGPARPGVGFLGASGPRITAAFDLEQRLNVPLTCDNPAFQRLNAVEQLEPFMDGGVGVPCGFGSLTVARFTTRGTGTRDDSHGIHQP